MTKEESLNYYRKEYSYYQMEFGIKGNKLACFYDFIPAAYEMARFSRDVSRLVRIINAVKKGTTRMFWPVIGHFNYPACSFYDADNQLLDIQEEMALEYKNCLDTLAGIVDEDNVSVIYPLMRVTMDCFFDQFALVDDASLKMRAMMIGEDVCPIDYTRFDLDVFLNFFAETIGGRESLEDHGKPYQKIEKR